MVSLVKKGEKIAADLSSGEHKGDLTWAWALYAMNTGVTIEL